MIKKEVRKRKSNRSTQIPPWDVPRGLGGRSLRMEIHEPSPNFEEHVPEYPVYMEVALRGVLGLVFLS